MVQAPVAPGIGVLVTGWRRPGYLRETLRTWSRARGIGSVHSFTMCLGPSAELAGQADVIHAAGIPGITLHMDSPAARASYGMHRALGEGIDHVLEDPAVSHVVCGEEDILVSDDVLEYMTWAFRLMQQMPGILIACAHNRGGTGWDDLYAGPADEDEPQDLVRAGSYYNPWIWGISRQHWTDVLRPQWDWDCDSGGPADSGYDWNIQKRVLPAGGWRTLVPRAARSQNIGRDGGVNSAPDIYPLQWSLSFREHRDPVTYKLEA